MKEQAIDSALILRKSFEHGEAFSEIEISELLKESKLVEKLTRDYDCRLQIRADCSLAYAKKLAVIIQLFQCFVLQYLQYQPLTPFRTVGSIQGIFFTEMAQKPVPVLPGPFQPYACPGFGTELYMIFLQGPAQIFQFPLNRAFAQIHPFRQVFDRYDLVLIQHN